MNALVTGVAAFFVAALGAICPHDFVNVPALFSVIVAGGYVGGTIFSLQSDGVYDLRIREGRAISSSREARLGGIWAYGLVGIPAGAIALLIVARSFARASPPKRSMKISRHCSGIRYSKSGGNQHWRGGMKMSDKKTY
jgi:hypothetical protein